jgi:hypothetical protein
MVDSTPPDGPSPGPGPTEAGKRAAAADPVLCRHCGRTASNGRTCEGICVSDSQY